MSRDGAKHKLIMAAVWAKQMRLNADKTQLGFSPVFPDFPVIPISGKLCFFPVFRDFPIIPISGDIFPDFHFQTWPRFLKMRLRLVRH